MNNNTLPLVTYEQARRLENAGFDWPVSAFYDGFEDLPEINATLMNHNKAIYAGDEYYSAPTVALALKWLRDVKCIGYEIRMSTVCDSQWTAHITGMEFNIGWFDTYEAAESALLDELLNIIETDGKNKKD